MKTEQPGGYVAQRDCSGLALVRGYRKGATPEARPYRPAIGSSAKAQEGDAPPCSARRDQAGEFMVNSRGVERFSARGVGAGRADRH